MSRRRFMKVASSSLAAISGLIFGIPFLDYFISPSLKSKITSFSKVINVENIPQQIPSSLSFTSNSKDAFLNQTEMHNVWVVKISDSDMKVFSPICPHLGCSYNWNESANEFICPCHNSKFDKNGKYLSGPAPRGLDTLPFKNVDGDLYVEWERFELGIKEKIKI